ncbi:hypothetical protein C2U72_18690 [Prosthecomicrobium hirschii]|uniref:hypothetical protein n=1 Tax=Prosthecodimorpha hirschii TaxID=665126 RepID=UPI00112C4689|nr:hypothetical protein [Prosthecomicrobium hirschii]TPQ49412.1 hypothetical protein C2U72_18690 [Prosthecomicrobium hirschii]
MNDYDLQDMSRLVKQINRFVLAFNRLRASHGLDFDDFLIVLAVVEINFRYKVLYPAPAQSVAAYIQMPYQTARRRLAVLAEAGHLHRSENGGYIVTNINLPKELLRAFRQETDIEPDGER